MVGYSGEVVMLARGSAGAIYAHDGADRVNAIRGIGTCSVAELAIRISTP